MGKFLILIIAALLKKIMDGRKKRDAEYFSKNSRIKLRYQPTVGAGILDTDNGNKKVQLSAFKNACKHFEEMRMRIISMKVDLTNIDISYVTDFLNSIDLIDSIDQ